MHLPAGSCFFRASVTVPEQSLIKSAELVITADNLFLLSINGKPAGESDTNPNHWSLPKRFDVAGVLQPGEQSSGGGGDQHGAGSGGTVGEAGGAHGRRTDGGVGQQRNVEVYG